MTTPDDRSKAQRGDLPHGGPSEAAARGLLDGLPAGYWARWGSQAAARIKAQAAGARCCCVDGGDGPVSKADARCLRCWGVL